MPVQTKSVGRVRMVGAAAVAVSRSPFTFEEQVQVHQGQIWRAEITIPPMNRPFASKWTSFLLKLNGREGTFLMGDPAAQLPRGTASTAPGTPLVNSSGQTGNTLAIDGLPVSTTGYLMAGDYIQLGSSATARLHQVLDHVNTNTSGGTTLSIWPKLRESPTNNANVIVLAPVGVFRLAENEMGWDIEPNPIYTVSLNVIEAI